MGGWVDGCVHNIDHPLKAGRFLLQLLVDGLPPNNINHSVYPLYILMLSINALSSHSSVHIFAKIFFLSITIIASPLSVLLRQNLMKLNPIGVDGWILIILKPHRQNFCSVFCQWRQNWIICKIQNSSVGKNWRKLGAKHHQLYV